MEISNNKNYFEKYVSNTVGGTENQSWFDPGESVKKGRVYYRIQNGGKFLYSLLFANTTDSTYADGSHSVCNISCDSWDILGMRVGKVKNVTMETAEEPEKFIKVTFDGNENKRVESGEIFTCDEFEFEAEKGEFLCLEITYQGRMIPYHEEIQIASFEYADNTWASSQRTPVACMVGCRRKVSLKIAYLGDSITQGIGATKNSYLHWNARLSDMIGEQNAYWNLGIGYARSGDAASDGIWLYKARQNDVVFVCFGVNDLFRGKTACEIKENLKKIVTELKLADARVIVQTIPPFDYPDNLIPLWNEANDYIKNELSKEVSGCFDCVPILGQEGDLHMAKYGGHPDDEGCRAWADALYDYVKNII